MMQPKEMVSQANVWREQYNPLRNLTIARAVAMLEAGQRGEFADLTWTYEFIEATDSDLMALVERRTSALEALDSGVRTLGEDVPAYDETLAEEQAAALTEVYEKIDNIGEAVQHLELAAFRGFSHIQPHRDDSGDIRHLECLDPWNFVRNGRYGKWKWNPEARACAYASLPEENVIDDSTFIIRVVRRAIDRVAMIKFIRANLSEKDWDGYIEIYGIPTAFVIEPTNVRKGARESFRQAAADAASGKGGTFPQGTDIKFPTEARGTQPFDLRLDYLSKKLILVGTGGMLTMLAESGSGTLAGGAHSETFRAIAVAEAARISELFQKGIDQPFLNAQFPNQPHLVYWQLAAKEEQATKDFVADVASLSTAGYQVDPEYVAQKTGYKLTLKPAPLPPFPSLPTAANRQPAVTASPAFLPASPVLRALNAVLGGTPAAAVQALSDSVDNSLQAAATDALAAATAADLAPLRARIDAALAMPDDAMLKELNQILTDLPDILSAILADPEAQKVLEDTISAALFNGLATGAVATQDAKI